MSLVTAVTSEGWALVVADTRAPAVGGGWRDDYSKIVRLRDGWAGFTGWDVGYEALHGAGLEELEERVQALHRAALERWGPMPEPGTESPFERRWGRPEDPEAVGADWYAKVAGVGLRGPVRVLSTEGQAEDTPQFISLPPGVPPAVERRIEGAARAPDPLTESTGAWQSYARAMARVVFAASQEVETVGPVADVGLVDRTTGDLRFCRRPAAELASMGDVALEDAVAAEGLLQRVGRGILARAQQATAAWR